MVSLPPEKKAVGFVSVARSTGFRLLNEGLFKPFTCVLPSKWWLLCKYLQHYCLKQAMRGNKRNIKPDLLNLKARLSHRFWPLKGVNKEWPNSAD